MDLSKIIELVKERKATGGSAIPQSSKEFLAGLKDEVNEVEEELQKNRRPHLEDELGDILWDYLHLLHSLESEERICVENVISRCEKKYDERVEAKDSKQAWIDIKERQKRELDQESQNSFN